MSESIREILTRAPATSKEIQSETGLSQGIVSRQLRAMGNDVVRLPGGRSPRYALTRNAFGGDNKLSLYVVDAHGNNAPVAQIRPLAHGGFFIEQLTGMPSVLLGASGNGIFEDLPYFLYDLSPQGFLGRQIAAEMATQSEEFPPDPRHWNTTHIGRYLISNGDDLPGNFQFGPHAGLRVRRKPNITSPDDYPELADSVMSGVIPGSSAGGEQPKFTTFCGERSSHVIVKFSPKGFDPVASRWRDVLITEYHATEAIHKRAFPAAETRAIEKGERLFLETLRFDRIGEHGRMPMISLQSVDAEFTGLGTGWRSVMLSLHKKDLVSWAHVYDALALWGFGRLINNTDMHLGNLSLGIEGDVFRLLPVYDMCSMGFAPKGGHVLPFDFTPPDISILQTVGDHFPKVITGMARDFWERVAADDRISDEFKDFLSRGNPIDLMPSE